MTGLYARFGWRANRRYNAFPIRGHCLRWWHTIRGAKAVSDSSTRVAAPSPPASVTASVGLLVALFGHFPVIWNMDFAIPIKLGINIAFTTGVLCLLTLLSPQRSLKLADWIEREAFNTA